MAPIPCPNCGRQAARDATTCPDCGHDMKNGTVPLAGSHAGKGPVPPEASGWIMYRTPPDLLARARQTFNEEEFLAEVREIEKTGGLKFEDFIEELEEAVRRRESSAR